MVIGDVIMKRILFMKNYFMTRTKETKFFMILSFVILVVTMLYIPKNVFAHNTTRREKTIVSVQIQEGDSLWSIASEYMSREYKSVKHYVKEIKRTNNLTSDTIHTGCHLIVPYYRTVTE